MSESHPIISNTENLASKNQIKMQGAFKSDTITTKFHINLNLALLTKVIEIQIIRFELIPGPMNFSTIIGYRSIVKNKIRLGFQMSIIVGTKEFEILNLNHNGFNEIGKIDSNKTKILYKEHPLYTNKINNVCIDGKD